MSVIPSELVHHSVPSFLKEPGCCSLGRRGFSEVEVIRDEERHGLHRPPPALQGPVSMGRGVQYSTEVSNQIR